MPGLETLYKIRRVYRIIIIKCETCGRGGPFSVSDALGMHGAAATPDDVARKLFDDCPNRPRYLTNGDCRWTTGFDAPLKLSEGPDELHLVCGSPRIGREKRCWRRRHIDTRLLIRRYGNITIAEFLRRAKCFGCNHKGAHLE